MTLNDLVMKTREKTFSNFLIFLTKAADSKTDNYQKGSKLLKNDDLEQES